MTPEPTPQVEHAIGMMGALAAEPRPPGVAVRIYVPTAIPGRCEVCGRPIPRNGGIVRFCPKPAPCRTRRARA